MRATALDPKALAGYARLRQDFGGFCREWLGCDIWSKQEEIGQSVAINRRTAVKSCHGSGKSFISARVVLWYLHAFAPSLVVTTAPTNNQVRNILWREINAVAASSRKPLLGRALVQSYEVAPDWYALGFKAEDTKPDRFQGFHAEHALVVIDEAAGVPDTVYQALDAVMTSDNSRMLLIGNPTNPAGEFFQAFHSARSLYHCITIAASDTPNFQAGQVTRPYLITPQWAQDAIAKHGADSPYVKARVDAEFPDTATNLLVPLAWLEAAAAREVPDSAEPVEAGLDVARMGDDENVLCIRQGMRVLEEHAWSGVDLMQTVGKVRYLLDRYRERLGGIKVDVIGVGAGVADRLRELSYPVVDVNVSARSSDPEQWANLRCELFWSLRERFREGQIGGQISENTMGQISDIRYRYDTRHTKPVIEAKEDIKKRTGRSPDWGEALLLAFANLETVPIHETTVEREPAFARESRGGLFGRRW